ncbi:MAG TPA: hypothetical protein VGI46_11900 [Candidatus Acidoferrum sp.]|jgi:hypothetical protein
MTDEAIDQAILSILSEVGGRWRKVASVIARVADAATIDSPDGDERYERVARRIEALVSDGRLIAQGDMGNWRYSEVRTPG